MVELVCLYCLLFVGFECSVCGYLVVFVLYIFFFCGGVFREVWVGIRGRFCILVL